MIGNSFMHPKTIPSLMMPRWCLWFDLIVTFVWVHSHFDYIKRFGFMLMVSVLCYGPSFSLIIDVALAATCIRGITYTKPTSVIATLNFMGCRKFGKFAQRKTKCCLSRTVCFQWIFLNVFFPNTRFCYKFIIYTF